jgi:hypothetical protein
MIRKATKEEAKNLRALCKLRRKFEGREITPKENDEDGRLTDIVFAYEGWRYFEQFADEISGGQGHRPIKGKFDLIIWKSEMVRVIRP